MSCRRIAFWAAAMAVLAVISAAPASFAGRSGNAAPLFELPDLANKTVRLEDVLKGRKAVLVNFWATWCPSCRREIPELARLEKELSGRLAVVGVDVGESSGKVSAYRDKLAIPYLLLLDKESKAAGNYGVVGLPESFLVDSRGKIVGEYHEFSAALEKDARRLAA